MLKKSSRRVFRAVCSLTLCLALLLTAAFVVPPQSASANTTGEAVNQLNVTYSWLQKDPEGLAAVKAAKKIQII